MTDSELLDAVTTWLMLQDQYPLPPPQTPQEAAIQAGYAQQWDRSILHNVSVLERSPMLKGTLAEDQLEKAVALAKTGNVDHIPEIEKLIKDIHATLTGRPSASAQIMTPDQARELILRSAALRGTQNFRAAIDLIKGFWNVLPEEDHLSALTEAFYAACEAGYEREAAMYARAMLKIDPGMPSARKYLGI